MIEPRQIRAARALLDWTREDLSRASDISLNALSQIESETRAARSVSLDKIRLALESAGVVFTDNAGVKLRSDLVTVFEGRDGFHHFMDDVYLMASNTGGEFTISGGSQADFRRNTDAAFLAMHSERMQKILNFSIRFIKPESLVTEDAFGYVHVKYIPDHMHFNVPFYVYGDKLAIITWLPEVRVVVLRDSMVAKSFVKQFDVLWKIAKPASVLMRKE
jgi:transcriptional regulator with XRE-family HTH domain